MVVMDSPEVRMTDSQGLEVGVRKYIQCKVCGVRHPVESGRGDARFECKGCGRILQARIPIFASPESTFWCSDTISLESWADRSSHSSGCWNQGRRFGPYQVLEEIARGGMGMVYKARHVGLNRIVAIKVLQGLRDKHGEMAARFRKEARTAANLRHPNIIPVFDVGHIPAKHGGGPHSDEIHYYAMEYIDGETLDEHVFKETISLEEAFRVVACIARAVEYVHKKGVVHRDVKPGNIIIDKSGTPYLMDFGLAKDIGASYRITRPGMAMGTPAYMSPEQAEGDGSIDGRADVYSLGALIYEILTGRPPFKGPSLVETMMMVVSEDAPSPRTHNPSIDRGLEAICMKCLNKERRKRYESALELAEDIEKYLRRKSAPSRRMSFRERVRARLLPWKKGALVVGAFAVAIAATALFLL